MPVLWAIKTLGGEIEEDKVEETIPCTKNIQATSALYI
jgi:hypothetical protein